MTTRVTGLSKTNRIPVIYNPTTKEAYDGKLRFQSSQQQIREWGLLQSYKSKYIPIKCPEDKTLEEAHKEFIERADLLKFQSKGRINLYRTATIQRAGLNYFFRQTCQKNDIEPDALTDMEIDWLIQCNHGQIVYNKSYKGDTYSYDVNSMYASIMRNAHFKVPMKQGTFIKLTTTEFDESKFYQYGIYRVNIINDGKENTRKMFRFNNNNYYTTIDLNVAKRLGLTITLIEDCQYNFLSYGTGACMAGSKLFKTFIDIFYRLKTETKNKDFKLVMNLLYGTLCMTNVKTYQYDITKDLNADIDLDPEKVIILNQYFVRDNIFKIEFCTKLGYFKYPWARLKPFILAFGRQMIGRIMEPYLDDIIYVNTDGFKAVKQLDIITGTNIGDLRFEGIITA